MVTESVSIPFRAIGISSVTAAFGRVKTSASGLLKTLNSVNGLIVGLGAVIGLTKAVGIIQSFELEMQKVRGVTGATEEEFQKLNSTSRLLGATTIFTGAQAAQGLLALSRAGFTANESIAAIPKTLNLAQAASIEIADASRITSTLIRVFNKNASEAGDVTDQLIKAANSANTDVIALGEGFSFAGASAVQLDISLAETAAAMDLIANAGIRGGRSGRGLAATLRQLTAESDKGAAILAKYGLTYDDVNPKLVGFEQALRNIAPLTKSAADNNKFFGGIASRTSFVLGQNVEDFAKLTSEIENSSGETEKLAKIMNDSLNGALKSFVSATQESVLVLGESGLTGFLKGAFTAAAIFINHLNGTTQAFINSSKAGNQMIETMVNLAALFIIVGNTFQVAFKTIVNGIKVIANLLAAVVHGFEQALRGRFTQALKNFAKGFTDVTTLLTGTVSDYTKSISNDFDELRNAFKIKAIEPIEELKDAAKESGQEVQNLGKSFEGSNGAAAKFGETMRDASNALRDALDNLNRLLQVFSRARAERSKLALSQEQLGFQQQQEQELRNRLEVVRDPDRRAQLEESLRNVVNSSFDTRRNIVGTQGNLNFGGSANTTTGFLEFFSRAVSDIGDALNAFFGSSGNAPTRHNGGFIGSLGANERAVVGEVGEAIFTPRQLQNADNLIREISSRNNNSAVQIVDQRGSEAPPVEVSSVPNGNGGNGKMIRVIIRDVVGSELSRGSYDGILSQGFGLNRKGV